MSKILFASIFAIIAILSLFFLTASSTASAQSPTSAPGQEITVSTPLGDLVGLSNHYGGIDFLGVRYAAPPTGTNRFRDAQDIEPWSEPQNATFNKAGCMQHCKGGKMIKLMCPFKDGQVFTSEDCLFMNIFTPTRDPDAKLPVLLFIHGGMYEWGSAEIPLYNGAYWGSSNNMIVVTINYRLNSFTGIASQHIRGNFGTTDQIMALKFINKIIASVGGDPNRITISGQSSGATSVGVLLVTPSAWNLFHGAVLFSDPIGFTLASRKMAVELGEVAIAKLGCPIGAAAGPNGTEQLLCLQSKTADEILAISSTDFLPTPNEVLSLILQWQPYADGALIPGDPIQQIQQGKFNKVPVYISNVANETAIFLNGINNFDAKTWMLDIVLDYIYGIADGAKIAELYGPIPPNYDNDGNKSAGLMFFSTILTDYTFYCPATFIADAISSSGVNVNFGFYDLVADWTNWYVNSTEPDSCDENSVCHAYDLPSYFYSPRISEIIPDFPKLSPHFVALSEFMQRSVGTFVHSGQVKTANFAPYNTTSRFMYNYSLPMPTAPMSNYRSKFCDFWNQIGYNRH